MGGGPSPIEISILEHGKDGVVARLLDDKDDLNDHRTNIAGLEKHIRQYPRLLSGGTDVQVPEIEKPETE